jgi:hypothetical protein
MFTINIMYIIYIFIYKIYNVNDIYIYIHIYIHIYNKHKGDKNEIAAAELDSLRKIQRKMKLEIDAKDKQLNELYSLS